MKKTIFRDKNDMNIILILVILFLYIHYSDYLKRSATEKLEEGEVFFQHSFNTFKVKIPMNNITIGQTFNKLSSKSKIEIYDTNFNLIGTYFDNNITYSTDKKKRLYGKISKSVEFKENNATEIRYSWILFEIDPNSEDTLDFIIDYSPTIWEEEPSLKWRVKNEK